MFSDTFMTKSRIPKKSIMIVFGYGLANPAVVESDKKGHKY